MDPMGIVVAMSYDMAILDSVLFMSTQSMGCRHSYVTFTHLCYIQIQQSHTIPVQT